MEPVTQASDVYAVGVLFYELVTGRRAFPVENQPDEAILRTHAAGLKPKWPSRMPIPDPFIEAIDLMLSAEPRDRPKDGSELFHLVAPLVRDLEAGRHALSLVSRDLVLSNTERPPPLFVRAAA